MESPGTENARATLLAIVKNHRRHQSTTRSQRGGKEEGPGPLLALSLGDPTHIATLAIIHLALSWPGDPGELYDALVDPPDDPHWQPLDDAWDKDLLSLEEFKDWVTRLRTLLPPLDDTP